MTLPPYDPFANLTDTNLAEEITGTLAALQAFITHREEPDWFTLGVRTDLDRAIEMGYHLMDRLEKREREEEAA